MGSREKLHNTLVEIFELRHVYFQPPESIKMVYPCIVYTLENMDTLYADDKPYLHRSRYNVTIIDKDPDSVLPDKLRHLPLCRFNRFYTSANLNHWVFSLYF